MIPKHLAHTPAPLLLKDFSPISRLWEGENPPYPSESSARWALRKLKRELASSQALALHRGRLLVHIPRFALLVEERAIAAAQARLTHPSTGEAS